MYAEDAPSVIASFGLAADVPKGKDVDQNTKNNIRAALGKFIGLTKLKAEKRRRENAGHILAKMFGGAARTVTVTGKYRSARSRFLGRLFGLAAGEETAAALPAVSSPVFDLELVTA